MSDTSSSPPAQQEQEQEELQEVEATEAVLDAESTIAALNSAAATTPSPTSSSPSSTEQSIAEVALKNDQEPAATDAGQSPTDNSANADINDTADTAAVVDVANVDEMKDDDVKQTEQNSAKDSSSNNDEANVKSEQAPPHTGDQSNDKVENHHHTVHENDESSKMSDSSIDGDNDAHNAISNDDNNKKKRRRRVSEFGDPVKQSDDDDDRDGNNVSDDDDMMDDEMSMLRSGQGMSREHHSDKIRELLDAIDRNAYDAEAWAILLHDLAQVDYQGNELQVLPPHPSCDIQEIREHFERFFSLFPTAGHYWKMYTEVEMRWGSAENVQKIFNRCLNPNTPHLALWVHYLNYIRNINGLQDGPLEQAPIGDRELNNIIESYEFALNHIGLDIGATNVWLAYIDLLDRKKSHLSFHMHADIVRKIYHNAISIPMHNVEQIWRRYETFEYEMTKSNAKMIINEQLPRYRAAVTKMREKKALRDQGLLTNMLSRPPDKSQKTELQMKLWKQLISLEELNTQRLAPEEQLRRVNFVYQQALQHLMHHQELWFEYARHNIEQNDLNRAEQIFERATEWCLPDGKHVSMLLHFAFCEFYEGVKRDVAKGKEVFERLLKKRNDPIVYIHYSRFLRKNDSANAARNVFIRATKQPSCTHHVYLSAALDEYHDTNSNNPTTGVNIKVAKKVFEKGLEKYITDPYYVLSFLDFLDHINDKNDMRVLFEKVLNVSAYQTTSTNIREQQQQHMNRYGLREIWNKYLEFEMREGEWSDVEKLEARRDEEMQQLAQTSLQQPLSAASNALIADFSYSRHNTAYRFAEKKKYLDLWPASSSELEFLEMAVKQDFEIEQESSASAKSGGMQQQQHQQFHQRRRDQEDILQSAVPTPGTIEQFKKAKKKMFKPDFKQMIEIDVHVLPPHLLSLGSALPPSTVPTSSGVGGPAASSIVSGGAGVSSSVGGINIAASAAAAASKTGILPEPAGSGTFIPDAVLKLMPLVTNLRYDGPLPDVDYVLDTFLSNTLPSVFGRKRAHDDDDDRDDDERDSFGGDDDEQDEGFASMPGRPSMTDIYRRRRQAKLQKYS